MGIALALCSLLVGLVCPHDLLGALRSQLTVMETAFQCVAGLATRSPRRIAFVANCHGSRSWFLCFGAVFPFRGVGLSTRSARRIAFAANCDGRHLLNLLRAWPRDLLGALRSQLTVMAAAVCFCALSLYSLFGR